MRVNIRCTEYECRAMLETVLRTFGRAATGIVVTQLNGGEWLITFWLDRDGIS